MLRSMSFKIHEMRRYLILSLVVSMIAIPIADSLVIQRDRNRNEMYGEGFWIYGFQVYEMTDSELSEKMGPPYNDGDHTLPDYLGNITYEYPVFGLIFFAIATWLYPGVGGFQPLWLNFILVLVFNLNLVLIAILLRDKIYNVRWARLFFAGYFIYGLIMSAGGGKLEPITDCLLLMALVLRQEEQNGKAMFTLGLSVQTKIYPVVALPILFLAAPTSIIWFLVSTLLTVIPFLFLDVGFDSLLEHFLNTSNYSTYTVNPMYPGLGFSTRDLSSATSSFYLWPPAFIPLVIYVAFMLYTIQIYLPQWSKIKQEKTWLERFRKLIPLYVYCIPAILFLFRWVMPWYLFWFGIFIFLFDDDERSIGYLKEITIVGFVYTFGVICNWIYFSTGPLIDFAEHFILGWWTIPRLGLLVVIAACIFFVWKYTFDYIENRARVLHEAESRGELVI